MKMITSLVLFMVFLMATAPAAPDRYREEKIARLKYEQEFERFINELGRRESGNQSYAINQIGCMGVWQIAPSTLRHLGYDNITPARFKRDPSCFPEALQRQILLELFKINGMILKDYILNYNGLDVGGVTITRAGILAASHLSGSGGVKAYLLTQGRVNRRDLNGTSVKKYLNDFSKYQI